MLPPPPSPVQYAGLAGYGLSITSRVPCMTAVTRENVSYLRTKQQKLGHWLPTGFDESVVNGEETQGHAGDDDVKAANTADLAAAMQCISDQKAELQTARTEIARLKALHAEDRGARAFTYLPHRRHSAHSAREDLDLGLEKA